MAGGRAVRGSGAKRGEWLGGRPPAEDAHGRGLAVPIVQ